MPSGYTTGLATSILYDVAVLYKGNTKFGVSVGGLTFTPEAQHVYPSGISGAPAPPEAMTLRRSATMA